MSLEDAARQGDAKAFGALIRELDHNLRGVAWSVVRDVNMVDDVMGATYEKAFKAIGSFDGRSAIGTWLHTICYRTALDHIKSQKKFDPIDDVEELSDFQETNEVVTVALDRVELAEVLEMIEPVSRSCLMLTIGLGYSYAEAAEIMGIKRGTVASKVARARQVIKEAKSD